MVNFNMLNMMHMSTITYDELFFVQIHIGNFETACDLQVLVFIYILFVVKESWQLVRVTTVWPRWLQVQSIKNDFSSHQLHFLSWRKTVDFLIFKNI